MSAELDEVTHTLRQLQAEFEDLAVGGLRAVGPDRLPVLDALREEFERIGAGHLAARLETLMRGIRAGKREAADALMRAQVSLRLFERILTLEAVAPHLETLAGAGEEDEA